MSKSKFTGNFNKSLRWGKFYEWETKTFIEETFNKVLKNLNQRIRFYDVNNSKSVKEMKGWDVKYELVCTLTNQIIKEITFEIKADGYDSNNVFFERSCNKKLSGVYTTTADYFLYILPRHQKDNVYICRPKDLIKNLDDNWITHLSYGGDGNRVHGFLIDRFQFNEKLSDDIKVKTYLFAIPSEFELDKLKDNTSEKVVYTGDSLDFMKDNPLNF